MIPTSARQEW